MFDNFFLVDFSKFTSNNKKFQKAKENNLFVQNFMRLLGIAMDRYKIEGLPDTVNERVVLQSLIVYGNATFFEQDGNVLCLPSTPSGKGFNLNGDPISAWVFSKNGLFNKEVDLYVKGGLNDPLLQKGTSYTQQIKNPKGVMVWDNKTRFPFIYTIWYYAQAITDALITIDQSKIWLKQPFIPVCEESLVPSVQKVFEQIEKNQKVIPLSSGIMSIDKLQLQPIGDTTSGLKSAMELVDWYEQQFRERCAITSNSQIDKKGENVLQDEIHMNDDFTDMKDNTTVEYLQEQFDFVNEMLGTNITVSSNKAEKEIEEPNKEQEEEIDNGNDTL